MGDRRTFVIVGAGLAGAKAAEALRSEGFDGRVMLFGAEATPPYSRPGLSKGYLRGERDRASLMVESEEFYAANQVELMLSTHVMRISPGSAEIQTDSGRWLGYDRLVLATGARPRALNAARCSPEGLQAGDAILLREEPAGYWSNPGSSPARAPWCILPPTEK